MGFRLARIVIDIHFGMNPVKGGRPPIDMSKIGIIHVIWGDRFMMEGAWELEYMDDFINKINRGVTTTTYIIKYIEVNIGLLT